MVFELELRNAKIKDLFILECCYINVKGTNLDYSEVDYVLNKALEPFEFVKLVSCIEPNRQILVRQSEITAIRTASLEETKREWGIENE